MIVLIRHGEATHHTENLTGGWTDSELTIRGQQQMTVLGEKLSKDFSMSDKPVIYSSDLKRAKHSAEIIGKLIGTNKIYFMDALREKNNGKAANLKEEEAKMFYRTPLIEKDLDHANYEGGETRRKFFNRTINGFHNILNCEQENIIIVAHKGTIQNIIFDWLGMNIEEVSKKNFSVDIKPASISILGINKWQEHAIFLLNETSYLQNNKGFGILNYKYGYKYGK